MSSLSRGGGAQHNCRKLRLQKSGVMGSEFLRNSVGEQQKPQPSKRLSRRAGVSEVLRFKHKVRKPGPGDRVSCAPERWGGDGNRGGVQPPLGMQEEQVCLPRPVPPQGAR